MNDRVARRSAPLSAPRHRAPNNFLSGIRNVCRLINDGRVLASQFQQHWSNVFGCRSHHDLSYTHASGEEYKIKGKSQDFRNYFLPADDGIKGFRLEILWDQFQKQLVSRWLRFRELQHARVASRKSGHRKTQREQERSVEWAND